MLEISYNYFENIDIYELKKIIKKYSLFEKTYFNSRFKKIIDYDFENEVFMSYGFIEEFLIPIESFTAVIAFNKSNNPVGILLFEKYSISNQKNLATISKIKYLYKIEGFIGMYVKPRYRKKGIANELASIFNKRMKREEGVFSFICAVQRSYDISRKNLHNFITTNRSTGPHLWHEEFKDFVKYRINDFREYQEENHSVFA